MRSAFRLLTTFAALLTISTTFASAAGAQELSTPTPAATSTNHPSRGMSMEKVEANFGAPAKRLNAVGNPPITRWEYPGFVVYFERNIVLHAVVTG
jgi:hypothetical protein